MNYYQKIYDLLTEGSNTIRRLDRVQRSKKLNKDAYEYDAKKRSPLDPNPSLDKLNAVGAKVANSIGRHRQRVLKKGPEHLEKD